jgi:hypothetical protein
LAISLHFPFFLSPPFHTNSVSHISEAAIAKAKGLIEDVLIENQKKKSEYERKLVGVFGALLSYPHGDLHRLSGRSLF